MATVQALTKSMIEKYIRSNNWHYMIDSDGDYRIEFAYDENIGCEITLFFMLGGSKKDVYGVLALSDKRYSKDAWMKATLLCNEWNKDKRWPRAYLHFNDANDSSAAIRLDQYIDAQQGIHQELLNDFSDCVVNGAVAFWKWIRAYDL